MNRNRRLQSLLLVVLASIAIPRSHAAETARPPEKTREIFVPFSDLNVLLENQPRRVLLSREEYDDLAKKAHKKAPAALAPRDVLLLAADYTASADPQRAALTGTLSMEVLQEGLHALPLDLGGVGLLAAKLDGRDAAIGRAADGRLNVLVEGIGKHQLVLDMVCPLESNAAQQVLNFRLPRAPIGRLRLSVPGDVEIRGGADVVSRVVDGDARVTRFELLPRSGDTTLVMSLNSHLQRKQQAVAARCVMVDEVTEAYEKLHATATLAVLHRAVDRFRFVVPQGFEITEITSPLVARWDARADGARQVANVYLREPATDNVVLSIAAIRCPCDLKEWRLPRLELLDVVGQVTVVGLLAQDTLKAESLAPEDLIPVDTSVLGQAVPATLARSGAGGVPLRAVAAYYAPHGRFALTGKFTKSEARTTAATNLVLDVAEDGCRVRGRFGLSPETEKCFSFDFSAPPGWQVTEVTGPEGKPLPFEPRGGGDGAGLIRVRLPEGIPPGRQYGVKFQAVHIPAGWLGEWKTRQIEFPVFAVAGASRDEGAVAVVAGDDMLVRPEKLDRLVPLTEAEKAAHGLAGTATSLAYCYDAPPYKAALTVERTQPRVTARTFSFFHVKPEGLTVRYELIYRVEEARARKLSLLLPAGTPEALSITGLGGLELKEFSHEPAGKFRRWNVLLGEAQRDNVRLAVDFQQPMPHGEKAGKMGTPRELPLVRAEGVAYQSGMVAVEGSPELDVRVKTDARRADVGQLAAAEYQPGRRLLGAFGYVGDPPPVSAEVSRHDGYALAPAIVERAELVTLLSASGHSQTQANFRLRTKASYLEVKLPADAELWSAQLGAGDRDGTALKPQRDGDSLLIGLPSAAVQTPHTLQLVYAAPVAQVGAGGRVRMAAPKLLLRGGQGSEPVEVPLANLVWRLRAPAGYEVVSTGGTLVTNQVRQPRPAPLVVAGTLYALGGGVNPFYSRPVSTSRVAHPSGSGEKQEQPDALARYEPSTSSPAPAPPAATAIPAKPQSEAEKRIAAALKSPTQLEFVETPLQDVVEYLKDYHQIEIQLDKKALAEAGIGTDTPITKNLKGISLRSALRLMLREHGLTDMIAGDVLLITTPETAERGMAVKVYPVADLVLPPGRKPDGNADFDSLIDVVTSIVEPTTWDCVGGQGSITPEPNSMSLVFAQTEEVHEQAQGLLEKLRTLRRRSGAEKLQPLLLEDQSPSVLKIKAALDSPTQMEFIETPLQDVIDYLKDHHQIEIQLDKRSMDEAGVGADVPVTKNLKGVSLRSALKALLRELGLTYLIQDEVLLIATPEWGEQRLSVVLYPVEDLVACRDKTGELWANFDSVVGSITSTVQPTTWDVVGGPGSIAPLERDFVLIVSQMQEVQEEIVDLLKQLRAARAASGIKGPMLADKPQTPTGQGMGGMGGMGGGMGGGFAAGMGGMGAGKSRDARPAPGRAPQPKEVEKFDIGGAESDPAQMDVDPTLEKNGQAESREGFRDDQPVFQPKAGGEDTKHGESGGFNLPGFDKGAGPAGSGGLGVGFGGRGSGQRKAQLAAAGGTMHTERTATGALNWLARHQLADGSWSFHRYAERCKDKTCTGQGSLTGDAGATGITLLPFLAAGQTHKNKGPYQRTIANGLNWLVRHQKPDGNLAPDEQPMMQSHAWAAIALCEAYALTGDREVGKAAQAAVNFILKAQDQQTGGWGANPGAPGDTLTVGWQVMALKSATMAGLNTNGGAAFSLARKWLDSCAKGPSGSQFSAEPGGDSSSEATAVGLLCRQYLGAKRGDPVLVEGAKYLLQNLPDPNSPNVYYWYHATQVMHNMPGTDWDTWNRSARRVLVDSQCKDAESCAIGSWDPESDPWGQQGGRVMTTALGVLTLETYYRYLPLFKTDGEGAAEPSKIESESVEDLEATLGAMSETTAPERTGLSPDGIITGKGKVSYTIAKPVYSLKGTRSLKIDLQQAPEEGEAMISFQSLGVEPELVVTLAQSSRLNALGWGLALAVGLLGMAMTNRSARAKARLVLGVGLAAVVVPLAFDNIAVAWLGNMLFYAASLLVPYYLLIGLVKWMVGGLRGRARQAGQTAPAATAAAVLLSVCALAAGASAAEPPPPPVSVPDDAIILPYDPQAGVREADRLLVPYARYVELWNRAHPEKKIDAKPAPMAYALAGASYQTVLEGDEYLVLTGRMEIDLYADGYVAVPLALRNGVLARAELDGKPARLSVAPAASQPQGANGGSPMSDDPFGAAAKRAPEDDPFADAPAKPAAKPILYDDPFSDAPAPAKAAPAKAAPAKPAPPAVKQAAAPSKETGSTPLDSLLVLHVAGKGRHALEVEVRLRLSRQGGWRVAQGVLPSAPATTLTLRVPKAETELRLSHTADRRGHETGNAGETVDTALGERGELNLQWRPRVTEGQVDRGLTARSSAVFDVREDSLRLMWQVDLDFQRAQRERFTFSVPKPYLVEKVAGSNVRGWEARQREQDQEVEVSLLKTAKDREQFTLHLSRCGKVGQGDLAEFDLPVVAAGDASLSSGQVTIRRSPLLDVRVARRAGVTRIDLGGELPQDAGAADEAVLRARACEAYQFATMPFDLRLSVQTVDGKATADVQTLVKVAEHRPSLESRVLLRVADRPIHQVRLVVPDDLQQPRVVVACPCHWTITEEGKRRVLCVSLAEGQQGDVPIQVSGTLAAPSEGGRFAVPRIEVCGVQRQQGDIAVQADPAFDVAASDLVECQETERGRAAWLNPQQREATRLVLRYSRPDHGGTLRLVPRKADVTCDTITNVRVTPQTVEETIYLNFTIRGAGARELSFLLPEWMADSRFTVPMLRQKTIGKPEGGLVRVRLELQEDVMNDYRVLVRNDRVLTPGAHAVPLPVVLPETARTNRQYVTIEPAGRDEVAIDPPAGMEPLARQQKEWQALGGILGNRIWRAYLVSSSADRARLSWKTVRREDVETAKARIEYARTVLVLDASGAYRAQVTFSLDNATEQFLEIEMPEGAALWTVHVAGEASKPVVIPDAGGDRLCVPILKTARGDPNHAVVLKYGGNLPAPGTLGSVRFPLVRTKNIGVEQSWLDLHLPESHRWFNFSGTMHAVVEEAEVQAGAVAQSTNELKRLAETLQKGDVFSRERARSNLKSLLAGAEQQVQSSAGRYGRNSRFQKEAETSAEAVREARKLLEAPGDSSQPAAQLEDARDNRARLNDLVEGQQVTRSRNVIQDLGGNWDGEALKREKTPRGSVQFNDQWLDKNKLKSSGEGKESPAPYYIHDDVPYSAPRSGKDGKQQPAEKPAEAPPPQMPGSGAKARVPQRDQDQEDVIQYQRKLQQRGGGQMPATIVDESRSMSSDDSLGEALRGPAAPSGETMRGEFTGDTGRGFSPDGAGVATRAAAPAGLASLDFDLPLDGRVYHFTTPRGEVELAASAVSSSLLVRLAWLGMVVVAGLLVWYDIGLVRRGRFAWFGRPGGAALLAVTGLISLVSGVLPIAGALLLAFALLLAARLLLRRRLRVPASAKGAST